jgi:hypothetical protein
MADQLNVTLILLPLVASVSSVRSNIWLCSVEITAVPVMSVPSVLWDNVLVVDCASSGAI